MAYSAQTWVDWPETTTPITAARLTYIEAGLTAAASVADAAAAASIPVVQVVTGNETRPASPLVIWLSPNGVDPLHKTEIDIVRVPSTLPGVTITTTGATFAPLVELAAGSTAVVTWRDAANEVLATGVSPTISFGSAGSRSVRMVCSIPGDVRTLNLGFDAAQDAGRDTIGTGYNHAPQPVSAIDGLPYLTGLRRFCAAESGLAGHVDFSGLTQLEFIECFSADIDSVDLTGCSSLIRLCLEHNAIESLDLNPVRATLRDLRCAEGKGASLTFTALTGPLAALWHFCTRDQLVIGRPPMTRLPVVEQLWIWGCAQTASDPPVSPVLNSLIAYSNDFDQTSVDNILHGLDDNGPNGGVVNLAGSAAPSTAGAAVAAALASSGWTVTVEAGAADPLFADTFDRANGPVGNGWVSNRGEAVLTVAANAFSIVGYPGYGRVYQPGLPKAVSVRAEFVTQLDSYQGIYCGGTSSAAGLKLFEAGGTWVLGSSGGPGDSNAAITGTLPAQPRVSLRLDLSPTGGVAAWINDVLVQTTTLAALGITLDTATGSVFEVGYCGEAKTPYVTAIDVYAHGERP